MQRHGKKVPSMKANAYKKLFKGNGNTKVTVKKYETVNKRTK